MVLICSRYLKSAFCTSIMKEYSACFGIILTADVSQDYCCIRVGCLGYLHFCHKLYICVLASDCDFIPFFRGILTFYLLILESIYGKYFKFGSYDIVTLSSFIRSPCLLNLPMCNTLLFLKLSFFVLTWSIYFLELGTCCHVTVTRVQIDYGHGWGWLLIGVKATLGKE